MTREHWHGTCGGYVYHGCRCEECRAARNAYLRQWRAQNRARSFPPDVAHGTLNAATNYGCNCPSCRQVRNAYDRARNRAAS